MDIKLNFVNFVNTLTTMSNCIEKHRIRLRHLKTVFRNIILKLILQNLIKIALYHYYKNKRFICFSYLFHLDRYSKYVCNNQSYYDIRGLSIFQFYKIAIQHSKVESKFVQIKKKWSSFNKKIIRF